MSAKQTSGTKMRPTTGRAWLLFLGLGAVTSCTEYSTFKDAPTNCSAVDGYEFDMVNAFEKTADSSALWGPSGDPLCNGEVDGGPAKAISFAVETMSDGPRCQSKMGFVFRSAHCNDWGALAGFSNFGPKDKHLWEGLSFWARSPGNTGKSFAIVMDDANTSTFDTSPGNCRIYDAGTSGPGATTIIDPATGQPMSGGTTVASKPDQCGNTYSAIVPISGEWRFYTVPFSDFTQTAQPNRVPNEILKAGTVPGTGFLSSAIQTLIIRVPKEMAMELWIDDLAFYRKRTGGTDAGVDAAIK